MTDYITKPRHFQNPGIGSFAPPTALAPMQHEKALMTPKGGVAGEPVAGGGAQVPPAAAQTPQPAARPQDTIQMFSRLNPTVQAQVLTSMGLTPEQAQQIVATIGQHPELQADSPSIVAAWQQLFGNSGIDVTRLGATIFSDSVHPADADHNYHNYGAIGFTPGQGLVATPESGQYGEPNHRGLRQLQPYAEIAAALGGAFFGIPALGELLGGGAAAAAGLGADAFAGEAIGLGAGAGAGADALSAGLGADAFAGEAIGAADPAALAAAMDPAISTAIDTSLAPAGGPFEIPGANQPFNVPMQPPPTVDIPPPDVNISQPGMWDRITNSLTADPLRTAGAALSVGSLLHNKPASLPAGLQNTVDANKPLGDQARDVLTHNGTPTPDQRTAIDSSIDQQFKQGSEAIVQASINAGQGGKDSMVTQDKIRAFKGQLETMRQELYMKQAEQNVLTAMQELGMVTQEQFALAQLELQQNTASQQRAMSIMQSLGWLFSMGGSKSGATPPAGP